eukprot:CAMPEP_0119530330 /NCGR_PEP_ID=MMETSP1344-20130328/44180_1 /TAXON_ID=236787 /ORGANISM="Florenciella parvula, Strain CCMP2471" /LENGTH=135 /DNA_ID=CAMNT_0007570227 /DNA_START=394 /DNA_END=801 /DNA_ORIENTATION=-
MYSSSDISSLPSEYELELVSRTGESSGDRASMASRAVVSPNGTFQPGGAAKIAGVNRGVVSGTVHGTRSTVHGNSSPPAASSHVGMLRVSTDLVIMIMTWPTHLLRPLDPNGLRNTNGHVYMNDDEVFAGGRASG